MSPCTRCPSTGSCGPPPTNDLRRVAAHLRPGQRISVRDLLYGLILRSGNDAAYDLARCRRRLGGPLRAPDEPARGGARPRRHPLRQSGRARPAATIRAPATWRRSPGACSTSRPSPGSPPPAAPADSLDPPRRIDTLNDLLLEEPWVTGVKTGHTFDAGYVLVGSGRRKGVELISAVIGAPTDDRRDATPSTCSNTDSPVSAATSGPCRSGPCRPVDPLRGRPAAAAGRALGGGGRAPRPAPDRRVARPRRSRGRSAGGRCSAARPSASTAGAPPRPPFAPGADSRGRRFDRVRSFVSETPVSLAVALFVILIGAVVLRLAVEAPGQSGSK